MKVRLLIVVLILSGLFVTAGTSYGWEQEPVAILTAYREYVIIGKAVTLDGSDSYDPGGSGGVNGIWKFEWDFTNDSYYDYREDCFSGVYAPDGIFDGITAHTYDTNGAYTARLRVTDENYYTDTDTWSLCVGPDSDSDDMQDDWELIYGLDPNDANDADLDSDSDGYDNLSEYLHASEPNNYYSVPSSSIIIYVPGDVDSIQHAINVSIDGDIIEVDEGTYCENISFYGKDITVRSANPGNWSVVEATVIDGGSSGTVVTFNNDETSSGVLAGFTITNGNSSNYGGGIYVYDSSPTIRQCIIRDNYADDFGGGMYINYGSPTVSLCIFRDNESYWDGAAMYIYHGYVTVTNCMFVKNDAGYNAGAIHNYSSMNITNCTFSGNTATSYGGAIYNGYYAYMTLTNCVLWGDFLSGEPDEIENMGYLTVSYCDVQGGWSGTGNIDTDPLFVDPNNNDYHLAPNSPCIDAGNPSTYPESVGPVDLDGNERIVDGDHDSVAVIDMGAYELPAIWFVDKDATGNDDGSSWQDAFDDLQDALYVADDGEEIWVAEGTYKPTSGSSRGISFALVEGVAIYGGFDGTETGLDQRDWTANETILSGDIGTPNDMSDNSYHVVTTGSGISQTAVLDGFIITGGNASQYNTGGGMNNKGNPTVINCTFSCNSSDFYGGGMCNGYYNGHSSPTLTNCTFSGNSSSIGGGAIFNYMYSNPVLTNCIFSGNSGGSYGGAINNYCSGPTLTNCTFSGNSAASGGGIHNYYSNSYYDIPTLINCTFTGNSASSNGGGMYNYYSDPTLTNCILWGDDAGGLGDEIYNYSGDPNFRYCDVDGCGGSDNWNSSFGTDGGGNIDSDPNFVDPNNPAGPDGVFGTFDDGLRLQIVSPCIDAADGDAAPSKDILGRGRIDLEDEDVDNTGTGNPDYADMGTYESYDGVDSDGDGMPDDWELIYGLDPTDPDDAELDGDDDELTNLEEYQNGTDPTDSDSDDDGMPDGWEIDNGLDPLDDDASEDPDNDGLSNLGEYDNGADPQDEDTDDDYMPDGWEVDNGLEPDDNTGDNGANGNPDGDDYVNLSEYLHGSDPQDGQSEPESTTTITVPTEVDSIQWAIDLSIEGDVIEVLPGTYYESIDFDDWAVTLTGSDPNDWWVVESTIIDADGGNQVVLFNSGEGEDSVLTGLMLTNGTYGISCGTSPTITNCIVEENSSHGIYCTSGSPVITNNMIGVNTGDGIYSSTSTPPTIKNNWIYKNSGKGIEFNSASSAATVRNNSIVYNTGYGICRSDEGTAPTISNCILWGNNGEGDELYNCSATYSCIEDGSGGAGNIGSDPLFFDADSDDYRLQRTSPCINSGTGTYPDEKDIEGQVRMAKSIDMGADEVCEVHNFTQGTSWYSGVDGEGIQDAIDDADDGDVIVVYEWTFNESVHIDDVNVTLTSTDPNNWDVVECTIIDADDSDANVIRFESGQDASSVLTGLTLTGGKNGIYCSNSSSPTIITCFITDNDSVGVACVSGSPIIKRCKIGENPGDGINSSSVAPPTIKNSLIYRNNGKGISFTSADSAATICNNTIVYNEAYGLFVSSGTEPNVSNCILWGHDGNDLTGCSATYSCIEDPNDANGIGNITSDPMFVNADSNNYCLDSSSPCVDAGDPDPNYAGEYDFYGKHRVFGEYVDMGAIEDPIICVKKGSTTPTDPYDTWDTAFGELKDALDPDVNPYLDPGTEIWVAKGTYKPSDDSGVRGRSFNLPEGVMLFGGFAAWETDKEQRNFICNETILSGDLIGNDGPNFTNRTDNSYHVVTGADGATLDGFIIEGGYAAEGDFEWEYGAGMYNSLLTDLITVSNCTFRNNLTAGGGGGMFNSGSTVNVTDCTFIDNQADWGGGMYNCSGSTVMVENCTFSENTTSGTWCDAGGMANQQSRPHLVNCVFSKNKAIGPSEASCGGGGMYNRSCDSGYPILENCIFSHNEATKYGGGMNNFTSSPTLKRCVFTDNSAGASGGGMDSWTYSSPQLKNCVFYGNSASYYGGGMSTAHSSNPTLTNCTFSKNKAGQGCFGGGMDNYYYCNPTLTNCILWGDTPDEINNEEYSEPTVTYCCVDVDGGYPGEENINANPEFVAPTDPAGPDHKFGTADDGLSLIYWGPTQDDDSPCIDAGDTCSEDTDIIGNKRTMGTKVDMGAYEAMETKAHWKLDDESGDASDSSGNGYHGEFHGTPTLKEEAGIFDDTYTFDGDDYVETDETFPQISGAITVSAWITVDTFDTADQTIINKASTWRLRRNGTNNTLQFVCDGLSPSSVGDPATDTKVKDGLWHHVVGVYDGSSKLYLYVDGVEDEFVSVTGTRSDNNSYVYIGGEDATTRLWKGMIDDVRVYDYALDDRQVKILFEEASYWRFVVASDSQGGSADPGVDIIFDEITTEIVKKKAEVYICAGDLVYGDSGDGYTQLSNWRNGYGNYELAKRLYENGITVMPIRGNHDCRSSDIKYSDWQAVFGADTPDNGPFDEKYCTYYVAHRNALFTALDQFNGIQDFYMNYSNGTHAFNRINQEWLNSVLADNTWAVAGDDARKHVFVAAHEAAFESVHGTTMADAPSYRNEFWRTLERELGCYLFFHGHDHTYMRSWISDGISEDPEDDVYQMTTGTIAGGGPADFQGDMGAWTPIRQNNYPDDHSNEEGYVIVEIWGKSRARTNWMYRESEDNYIPGPDVFSYTIPEDTPPTIKSAEAVNKNTVVVVFSEWVEKASAEDENNYTIDNGIGKPSSAVLSPYDAKKVILTTSDLAGTTYELDVDNVRDRSSDPDNKTADNEKEQFTYQAPAPGDPTFTRKVTHPDDDAEEWDESGHASDGEVYRISTDLELINDGHDQFVGIRFRDVYIPKNATISSAYIQFSADGTSSDSCTLTIKGQLSGNAGEFTLDPYDISGRPTTDEFVSWSPGEWNDKDRGAAQQTDTIKDVIEEIVGQDDWSNGNSVVIIFTGSGLRRAWSWEGSWRPTDMSSPGLGGDSGVPELVVKW